MSENSSIEWTDHTFSPWAGCHKVSAACTNCYAANLPPFMRRGAVWGKDTERVHASESYWKQPLKWNKAAEKAGVRARVFCASVADVFEDRPDLDAARERLWLLIEATPWLDWLLLTKRPHVMARWAETHAWPENAWAGCTVESQKCADERIPFLLRVPARVRFLSMEPLGGYVDLTRIQQHVGAMETNALTGSWRYADLDEGIDGAVSWVIVGGESGHKAKPMHPSWAQSLRDQCVKAGVAFLFKQWGEWAPKSSEAYPCGTLFTGVQADGTLIHPTRIRAHAGDWIMARVGKKEAGRLLDGRTWDEFPPDAS